MKLIVCLDDKNGMSFYGRRQSADSAVITKIKEYVGEHSIYMDPYSEKLFSDKDRIIAAGNFLDLAGNNDCCFAEITDVSDHVDRFDEIVIFRWNRVYPADLYFPLHLIQSGWNKRVIAEFSGTSHDDIWQEVYRK